MGRLWLPRPRGGDNAINVRLGMTREEHLDGIRNVIPSARGCEECPKTASEASPGSQNKEHASAAFPRWRGTG
jgi:hypothetical protein